MYIILLPIPYFVQSILFILQTTPSVVTLVAVPKKDVAAKTFEAFMFGILPVVLLGANIVNVSVSSLIGIK